MVLPTRPFDQAMKSLISWYGALENDSDELPW
jgi:hypothetical protein